MSNIATLAAVLFIVGCIVIPDTIHITIDIRHVEQQADNFLDYVEGKTDLLPGEDETNNEDAATVDTSWLQRGLEFFAPVNVAYAAELNESSSRVTQIANSMKKRNAQVVALKKQGSIGENNRGFLELVRPEALAGDEEKNKVQAVVAAENADRKALYKELARLNKDQSLDVTTIEGVYAKKRRERAKLGEHIQLPKAGPDLEALKKSPLAKKLSGAIAPGAWVTLK